MGTPARGIVLEAICWQLPRVLGPRAAHVPDVTVGCEITREGASSDRFQLQFHGGGCQVIRGAREPGPPVRIASTAESCC